MRRNRRLLRLLQLLRQHPVAIQRAKLTTVKVAVAMTGIMLIAVAAISVAVVKIVVRPRKLIRCGG